MREKGRKELFSSELYNEGWLLRVILDGLKGRPEVSALLNFVKRCLGSEKASQGGPAPRLRE